MKQLKHTSKIKKRLFVLLFFLLAFFTFSWQIVAQPELEFDYPTVPGVDQPISVFTPITEYLKYIYNFSIIMSGFLIFVLFVWGGVKYTFSTGNPAKMTDAREQITSALLGFIVIFGSYAFLRTINPRLVIFPDFVKKDLDESIQINPLDVTKLKYNFKEIPIATLITKEYTASSFVLYPELDPPYNDPQYEEAFPETKNYPGDFQGGLHGRRLKRVLEVATTTVPLSGEMVELARGLKELTDQCTCAWNRCVCRANCAPSGPAACERIDGGCEGEICSEEIKEKIRCQQKKIEYFSGAYRAFLDANNILEEYVKENQGLLDEIRKCDPDWAERIKEALIKPTIEVENKGTRSPITNPPERDVQTNIFHLEAIFISLIELKERINPYGQFIGSLDVFSWHGLMRFFTEAQLEERKTRAGPIGNAITVPYVVRGTNVLERVRTSEDPALFYAPSLPGLQGKNEKMENEPQKKFSLFNNVFAQNGSEEIQTKTICSRMVEVPIGKAMDEALKLMEDVLRELKNIWEMGHKQIRDLKEMSDLAGLLIEEETCKDYCDSICVCVVPCDPASDEDDCTECLSCACDCEENALLRNIKTQINDLNEAIRGAHKSIIGSLRRLSSINPINRDNCCINNLGNCRDDQNNLKFGEIKEREYTLRNKLAEIQKLLNRTRETINKNREKNDGKSVYEILILQLLKTNPPLANREELTRLLTEEKLDMTNCDVLYAESQAVVESREPRKSLVNCKVARGEVGEHLANPIRSYDNEVCSPDPLLDCDYFNPSSPRRKKPFSCYCHHEDIQQKGYNERGYRLPPTGKFDPITNNIAIVTPSERNLANNLYCCVIPYEN